jgi:hypothetical protein
MPDHGIKSSFSKISISVASPTTAVPASSLAVGILGSGSVALLCPSPSQSAHRSPKSHTTGGKRQTASSTRSSVPEFVWVKV